MDNQIGITTDRTCEMAVINLREPIMAQRFVPVACPLQALEQSKLDGVFLRMPPTFRKQLLNMLLVQEVSTLDKFVPQL